jgi:hypothetical protein
MVTMKRIALTITLLVLILPSVSLAEKLNVEVDASSHDIDLRLSLESPLYENTGEIGFGLSYSDDYLIPSLNCALKGEVFIPRLTLGLGFKGVFGKVEIHDRDHDLRAIGFHVLGEYDFGEQLLPLPLIASVSISIAPSPLCFSDTDRYLDLYAGMYLYIVKNGAIGIVYRWFEARFDVPPGELEESYDALLVGFKLSF